MSDRMAQHRPGNDGPQGCPSAERCERLIEEAPIGIFQSTFAGRFLTANATLARMFGYATPAELIGGVSDIATMLFVHPEQRPALLQRVLASHQFLREEVLYRRSDGVPLIANLYLRAVRDEADRALFMEGYVEDITDRKRAEEALQRSEEKYRDLVENANSIILRWSRDGVITFLNEYGLQFFGYTEEEILGRPVEGTIVPDLESTGRDLRTLMADICANPEQYEHNVNENMRRNGEHVWIAWTNKVVFDERGEVREILSVGTDITERKRTEEALKENEALFRSLADNANAIVGILQGTRFVYVNPYFAQVSGYSLQELLGMDISQVLSSHDRAMVVERAGLRQAGVRTGPSRYELTIATKDGGERILDLAAASIEYQKKPAIIGIAHDITERKRDERELEKHREHLEDLVKERTAELAQVNERLRELDTLKSMFIASMSHELRTPLNSIIGFTGMTLQGLSGEINAEQRDNLTRVYQSSRHLLALITDVIDISKIEAGRIDTFVQRFPLGALIDEAVETILPQAREKGLPVTVELADEAQLQLDRKRLLQCLLNLLSNAVKFTESGHIILRAGVSGEALEVAVADTGIGIAEEDRPKLFEAFERLESHLRVKAGGTGLGLYLTKKIVTEILHGTITVESQVGVGSTFTVRIPARGEQ